MTDRVADIDVDETLT